MPVHLDQISLSPQDEAGVDQIIEVALTVPIIANEPFEVTRVSLRTALLEADASGIEVARSLGDDVYRPLHA